MRQVGSVTSVQTSDKPSNSAEVTQQRIGRVSQSLSEQSVMFGGAGSCRSINDELILTSRAAWSRVWKELLIAAVTRE
jgi:hypothetical protein